MPPLLEIALQRAVVVDFSVADDPDGPVLVRDGLFPAVQVDDGKTPVAKGGPSVAPDPFVVGTAVPERIQHPTDPPVSPVGAAHEPRDTAHDLAFDLSRPPRPHGGRTTDRIRIATEMVADRQVVQMPQLERTDRIGRCAHDGLLVHVETRVDDGREPGQLVVLRDDGVEGGIVVFPHELRPGRVVDVDDPGAVLLHPRRADERDRHEARGVSGAVHVHVAGREA